MVLTAMQKHYLNEEIIFAASECLSSSRYKGYRKWKKLEFHVDTVIEMIRGNLGFLFIYTKDHQLGYIGVEW